MEDVFSSAYCVIAASGATGTSDGFLKDRPQRDFVMVSGEPESPLYVCEFIDDFDQHVLQAGLNKRGWVLQERALARRTIYFAKEQTYWECGHGIRCETLTKMTNNKAAFFGDPKFPQLAIEWSKGGRIRLFQILYSQYSRLALSKNKDRPLAIAGLEKRMIETLHKECRIHGGYGILESDKIQFGSFLGRSLLWVRASNISLERIVPQAIPILTWSWMAYEGEIDYMHPPFGEICWTTDHIITPWNRKSQWPVWHTGSFNDARLTAFARDFVQHHRNEIAFDNSSKTVKPLKCVLIGRTKLLSSAPGRLYVLIVAPKPDEKENQVWERVGAGVLHEKSVCGPQSTVQIA